jgi:hypothetical protein
MPQTANAQSNATIRDIFVISSDMPLRGAAAQ